MKFKTFYSVRTIYMIVLILFSFGTYSQNSLDVKVLNPPSKIKPGESFTLILEVQPNRQNNSKIEVKLLLPDKWQLIMTKKPNSFENEKTFRYLFTVTTPYFTPNGLYNIGIQALGNGYIDEIENLSIEVIKIRKLEVISLNSTEYVKEGDTLKTSFWVQNLGNNSEKVALKSIDGKIELPQNKKDSVLQNAQLIKKTKQKTIKSDIPKLDSLLIEPNQSVEVRVLQIVPSTIQNYWHISPNLDVLMSDTNAIITKSLRIPVFSNKIKKADLYLRFPLEVGGSYNSYKVADKQILGYQFNLSGKGFLDFKKSNYLNFTILGPSQLAIPAFGAYDLYSFEYSYKNKVKVFLGDYTLRVNNLIEYGRLGRGISFEQSFKKLDYTFFYTKPRFSINQLDTYGALLSLKPTSKVKISFSYLNKVATENSLQANIQLVGVGTDLKLKRFSLSTELASSYYQNKYDFGFFNNISWEIGKLRVNNNFIYTTKEFGGFYKDSYLLLNNLNYSFSRKVSLFFNTYINRLNPNYDQTVVLTSPYSQNNSLGINYQLNKFNKVFLGYDYREVEDRSSLKKFYFTENFARLNYNVNSSNFIILAQARVGTSRNLLTNIDSSANQKLVNVIMQPEIKLLKWLWLGGYMNYQRSSNFSTDSKLKDFYFYGGSLRLPISNTLNLNANFRNNFAPDELIEQRSFIDIGANFKLGNHELTFSGGKSYIPILSGQNQNIEFYRIMYKLKLNAPITRNKSLSSIRGQILGMSSDINLKGMIVELGGKKFMTDSNGGFYFNNLLPDKYLLNIARTTMGKDVIATGKNPMVVNVKADSVYKIEIPLTKACSIIGKVDFRNNENIGTIDFKKEKPTVLIKLINEKESFVTQVNEKDEFSFKEIYGGKWRMSVVISGKAEQFIIKNLDENFELLPGSTKLSTITISPKERKIYFSDKTHRINNKSKK